MPFLITLYRGFQHFRKHYVKPISAQESNTGFSWWCLRSCREGRHREMKLLHLHDLVPHPRLPVTDSNVFFSFTLFIWSPLHDLVPSQMIFLSLWTSSGCWLLICSLRWCYSQVFSIPWWLIWLWEVRNWWGWNNCTPYLVRSKVQINLWDRELLPFSLWL